MSFRALEVLRKADVVVGYKTYINLVADLIEDKKVIVSGMREELKRCRAAVKEALKGKKVAVISSGDPGIYGMAGPILEVLTAERLQKHVQPAPALREENRAAVDVAVDVEVIPGITAAGAAAASLGAPLMHDFAAISLSDLLTPWDVIEKRLVMAAEGDFVTVLYNPRSRRRTEHIKRAREIFLKYRAPGTVVGIVRNSKRGNEKVYITTLQDMLSHPVDMLTTVIIGNSRTFVRAGYMLTPRGYYL